MTNFRFRDHASFVITAKETMAFIIKKKRYKFSVDLTLNELTEVSFGKAILFAKVRQLDGGSFEQSSKREEVSNHAVKYDQKFSFPCKMAANYNTGIPHIQMLIDFFLLVTFLSTTIPVYSVYEPTCCTFVVSINK